MTTEAKKYRAAIGKQVYVLRSDEPEIVVQSAISWVSAQFEKNIEAAPDIDQQRAAVLVALQAAIEFSKLRSTQERSLLQVEGLITRICDDLLF